MADLCESAATSKMQWRTGSQREDVPVSGLHLDYVVNEKTAQSTDLLTTKEL